MILEHLPPGLDTVGVRVEFDHTAATLIGREVVIDTAIAEVKGRKVVSSCTIRDSVGVLGEGQHTRFIGEIDLISQRLNARLEELNAKAD